MAVAFIETATGVSQFFGDRYHDVSRMVEVLQARYQVAGVHDVIKFAYVHYHQYVPACEPSAKGRIDADFDEYEQTGQLPFYVLSEYVRPSRTPCPSLLGLAS